MRESTIDTHEKEHLAQGLVHSRGLPDPKTSVPPTVSHRKPTPLFQDFVTYVQAACLPLGMIMCHFPSAPGATLSLQR